ncbi:hypothetical protein KP509_19G035700 [Ceratopteris richardii]|nr:hypothetical protein KP509_19G035700 [Ceratopteris richardii]
MERAVLDYYAELWNAKWPYNDKDKESYWGFCLTMGSTEGNLYGMWNGRDYLGGKKILIDEQLVMRSGVMVSSPRFVYQKAVLPADSPNAYTPIAFFSEDTHYSISKAMTMLSIQTFYAEGEEKYPGECPLNNGTWPAEVPSHESGAMNIDSLSVLVEFFASRGYPIIVCFNYGTTFKGAYDDVSYACRKLKPILEKYNLLERDVTYGDNQTDKRTGFWFHVDGALGAAYMPFIEMAYLSSRVATKGPTFDFRLPMVHSIAMSGHKWIGAPVPCGVFMTRVKYQMLPPEIPEYIGSPDTTFAGSRNGLSPMLLWDNIARHSYEDQIQKALDLEQLAAYAEDKLLYLQNEVLHTDLFVARTKLALTVRFKRANEKLCRKYSLSNEDLGGRRFSHIFLMEHVTTELVDQLIEDLSLEDAFAPQEDVMTFTVDPSVRASTKNRVAFVPSEGRGFHG